MKEDGGGGSCYDFLCLQHIIKVAALLKIQHKITVNIIEAHTASLLSFMSRYCVINIRYCVINIKVIFYEQIDTVRHNTVL